MTPQDLLKAHDELCWKARTIMARKNQDYASATDPLANIRGCESLGVSPITGIGVRMVDKICRLMALEDKPPAVTDESFEDTCIDLINYAILARAVKSDKNPSDKLMSEY